MQENISDALMKLESIKHNNQEIIDILNKIKIDNPASSGYVVDPIIFAITLFILSCFIGYYVVWKVTPALHAPLMSITNAISGVIILGSLVATSFSASYVAIAIGFFATFFAAINVFGGFIVTERMLQMFHAKPKK